ncbi:MAG: GP88 family protein [Bacteroidales bacterium]
MTKLEILNSGLEKLGLYGTVVSFGNIKLPKSTMIFNMSTATNCPSMDFCTYVKVCYARRMERIYKMYKKRNERNYEWFQHATVDDLKTLFKLYIEFAPKSNPIKQLRLNEAGDFINQDAVDKFSIVATWLKEEYNIITYAYSCRIDLDFSKRTFILNASHSEINSYDRMFKCTPKTEYKKLTKTDVKCYGDCKRCKICYQDKYKGIVYCLEH